MTTGRYTRIGSSKGPLTIGGAERKMEEDSTFTYLPGYNVAGTLSEIETWLTEHKHPDDAKASLQHAFNVKNLKKAGVRKAFIKELEQWQEHREDAQRKRQDDRQINLLILVEFLKRYQSQRKTDGLSRPSGGRKTIRDKLAEVVVSGKVMDVTSTQEKGRGITRAVMKNNSIKKRLVQDPADPLYNVVYNPKTATVGIGVRNFLTEYGGFTDGQISEIVDAISDNREVSVVRTVTPSRQRTSSPLTKRFSSPLRREMDTSVDDLLDNLA